MSDKLSRAEMESDLSETRAELEILIRRLEGYRILAENPVGHHPADSMDRLRYQACETNIKDHVTLIGKIETLIRANDSNG